MLLCFGNKLLFQSDKICGASSALAKLLFQSSEKVVVVCVFLPTYYFLIFVPRLLSLQEIPFTKT